jgi:hypothetical protein
MGILHSLSGHLGGTTPPLPLNAPVTGVCVCVCVCAVVDCSFSSVDLSRRSQGRDTSSKVKKTLGDDAPSPSLIHKPQTQSPLQDTAWFLKHDLEDDLAYDVKGQVKGGTLDALMERLTRHDMMDSTFNQTFLLTFKSFTTAEEFFDKLIERYLSPLLFCKDTHSGSILPHHRVSPPPKQKHGKKKFNVRHISPLC